MILLPAADAAFLLPEELTMLMGVGVEIVPELPRRGPSTLALTRYPDGLWGLHDPSVKRGAVLKPDFMDGTMERRVRMTWHMHEPLRNALGATKSQHWTVLDATCGLGTDAWMMAAWGHQVRAYERHPLLAWLLQGAWQAAGAPASVDLRAGDAQACTDRFQVVYLDPMYPESKKSALPSGELQLLRRLLEGDEPPDNLLDWALGCATMKVVVKRPKRAETLPYSRGPSFVVEEQSTRYDVYVP